MRKKTSSGRRNCKLPNDHLFAHEMSFYTLYHPVIMYDLPRSRPSYRYKRYRYGPQEVPLPFLARRAPVGRSAIMMVAIRQRLVGCGKLGRRWFCSSSSLGARHGRGVSDFSVSLSRKRSCRGSSGQCFMPRHFRVEVELKTSSITAGMFWSRVPIIRTQAAGTYAAPTKSTQKSVFSIYNTLVPLSENEQCV